MSFALLCSFLFTFNVSVVQWLYMQWLFKVGTKSLQYSIKNRHIQRTMCIWLFFERSILAHLKNSLNDTDSNTQKVWWIIWETSGLPTRDTIYMLNMMIENKIYSITLTGKAKWGLKKHSFVLLWCILLKTYKKFSWKTSGLPPSGGARACSPVINDVWSTIKSWFTLNTSVHDISDVFEPASDPLARCILFI